MNRVRAFGAFWYEFVVGDDPLVAVGVVVGLALTALFAHGQLTSWWVLPVAAVLILAGSLFRAARQLARADTSETDVDRGAADRHVDAENPAP